jgi:hypothetical protein
MKIVSLDNHRDPHPDRAKRLAGLRVPMHQDRVEEIPGKRLAQRRAANVR